MRMEIIDDSVELGDQSGCFEMLFIGIRLYSVLGVLQYCTVGVFLRHSSYM
jgi:hypothetical protein